MTLEFAEEAIKNAREAEDEEEAFIISTIKEISRKLVDYEKEIKEIVKARARYYNFDLAFFNYKINLSFEFEGIGVNVSFRHKSVDEEENEQD